MKLAIYPLAALAAALSITVSILPALAAEGDKSSPKAVKEAESKAPAEGSQQHKMKTCNAEAGRKNLKGEERKAFMSACLKG